MHGNQEWETSAAGLAVLSIGPARCYKGKTRHEESHFQQQVERNWSVPAVSWKRQNEGGDQEQEEGARSRTAQQGQSGFKKLPVLRCSK
jgi:hypothetical protein